MREKKTVFIISEKLGQKMISKQGGKYLSALSLTIQVKNKHLFSCSEINYF